MLCMFTRGYPHFRKPPNGDKPRDFTSKTAASPLQLINDGPLIRQSLAEMAGLGTQQPKRFQNVWDHPKIGIDCLPNIIYGIIYIYLFIYLCVCVFLIHAYQYVYTYIYINLYNYI